jgi:hypothetical protein
MMSFPLEEIRHPPIETGEDCQDTYTIVLSCHIAMIRNRFEQCGAYFIPIMGIMNDLNQLLYELRYKC